MKILFIGARLFDDVAMYAKEEGITTILTESNPKSPNLNLSDIHYIVPRGMEYPKDIAIKEDVDAVVPLIGVDKPLVEIARLKEELENVYDLPVVASGIETAQISIDKFKTKEFLIKNGIKTPKCRKISRNSLKPESYPLVLKQREGQGGSGLKIVSSASELETYFKDYNEAIAEEFMDGFEISVEVLRWRDESIPLVPVYKGKTTMEGFHPLKKTKTAPADIDGLDNEYLRSLANKVTIILGAEGNTDVDMICDMRTQDTYVIEMNTRPSGTRYLTTASTNINPMHELVNMASGTWSVKKIKKQMENNFSLEIPVGNYSTSKDHPKYFSTENSWILHGLENFQRITIRAKNATEAFEMAKKLNIKVIN
ncbi:MAG: ATP-grasp domain-containing protein [Euryarchaeota archaeon]|nr:ATP-grasp domain-containing protein [Euryarchaeota archaeon]